MSAIGAGANERAAVAVETFKSKVHAIRISLAITSKIFEVTGLARPHRSMVSIFIGATCEPRVHVRS